MCEFVDESPGARELVQRTLRARQEGRLPRRFTRDEWALACSVRNHSTRRNFLRKHRVGNGKTTERFVKHGDGTWTLIGEYRTCDRLHKEFVE